MENPTNSTLDLTIITTQDDYNLEYAEKVFPVIVFLFTVMVIGGIGNILVCAVYLCSKRKCVSSTFIIALATLDLVKCMLCIPAELADVKYKATFGEFIYICKGSRTLVAFSTTASCGVLVAIAIDRYRNICIPFSHQVTLPVARTAILICCVLAVFLSVPAWFVNGRKVFKLQNGTEAADCAITKDHVNGIFPKIYNGCFFFLFLSGCVILIVLYTLIWKRLKVQDRFRRAIGKGLSFLRYSKKTRKMLEGQANARNNLTPLGPSDSSLTLDTTEMTPAPSSQLQRSHRQLLSSLSSTNSSPSQSQQLLPQPVNKQSEVTQNKPRKPKACNKSRTPPRVNKTTFIMFLITVLFITSFLPYVSLTTVRSINKHAFENLNGLNLVMYNLFVRFHFLNSAFNPVVYSFCGQQFRTDFRMFLRNLWFR